MNTKQVTVKIDRELIERVDKISRETGIKKKVILNTAIRVYLDDFEKSLNEFKTITKLGKE